MITDTHRAAGRTLEHLPSSPDEPDMVSTANAAVVRGSTAMLGDPPNARRGEIPHTRA